VIHDEGAATMTVDGRLEEVRAQARRLVAASWLPGLVTPDYAARCISNLPAAIEGLFGVPAFTSPGEGRLPLPAGYPPHAEPGAHGMPGEREAAEGRRGSGRVPTRRVLLIVLDAFGLDLFLRAVPEVPPLARVVERGSVMPLTSVFPSTTNVALTSLYTGLTPAEHGMVGLLVYLRQLGVVANLLRFHAAGEGSAETLPARGLEPRAFFPVTTLFERLAAADVPSVAVTRHSIHGTSLASIHHAGATVATYLASSDLCVTVRRLLEGEDGSRFVFAYWDLIDTLSHRYGPSADEVIAEVASFFATLQREVLERLSPAARRETLLLITADHGHVPMPGDSGTTLEDYAELRDCLMLPPTGGARYPYFTALPGRTEELRDRLRPLEGPFRLLEADQALAGGLFGRDGVNPEVRSRIGDLIALATGDACLWQRDTAPETRRVRGLHGGLSEEEMLVPLLTVGLDAL
jgi:Type I phosphodiesterase / nucleotide pyrophosphatase